MPRDFAVFMDGAPGLRGGELLGLIQLSQLGIAT